MLCVFLIVSSSVSPYVIKAFSHFLAAKLHNVAVFVTNAPATEAEHNYWSFCTFVSPSTLE